MMHSEESLIQTRDNLKLYCRLIRHPQPRGRLIVCHGHGEHTGRYLEFSDYATAAGLSVALFDYRGHGRSEGPITYVRSFEDYIDDLSCFFEFVEKNLPGPGKPILYGNSLGGLLGLHWAGRNANRVEGLIFSAPCFGLRLPAFVIGLNRFFSRLCPGLVYKNPVYPPYLTHDVEEMAKYRRDPLIRRRITARLLDEMIRYAAKAQSGNWQFSCPVFMLVPAMEKVVDPEAAKRLFDNIQAPQKKWYFFPGFYHEIFHEAERNKAFAALQECFTELTKGFPSS